MRADQGEGKRKKGKRGTNVPLSELGFKAKVYYGIETEYTRRRVKYKAARYGVQNSKECFMGRLTFILDANTLSPQELDALPTFTGIKKHEWEKVRLIVYHSREELVCAICLERRFQAPQMTHCGHVFCWHCIYMHHYKSLKANNCPVCNELYSIDQLVACKPIYGRSFQQFEQNRIKLALKCHPEGSRKVYSTKTFREETHFARVLKATTERIVTYYQQEKEELEKFLHDCEDEETKKWVAKVISLSYDKIEQAAQRPAKREYKLHRNQTKVEGFFLFTLQQKERATAVNFYQEEGGRLIFLHPLCDKFLRACGRELPEYIQEQIVQWEEVEYNLDLARRYKQLHHIVLNQEIDLVVLNLSKFLKEDEQRQLDVELEQSRARKKEEMQREERESVRLQAQYEQEKEYIQKLKKMEESEFYDIKVPTTIDPNELGDNTYFPSLIQTRSQPDPTTSPIFPVVPEPPKQKKKEAIVLNEGDFPGLVLAPKQEAVISDPEPPKLQLAKSEEPKLSSFNQEPPDFPDLASGRKNEEGTSKFQKKNSRKKKEKFVNVTEQFFQRRQEDD